MVAPKNNNLLAAAAAAAAAVETAVGTFAVDLRGGVLMAEDTRRYAKSKTNINEKVHNPCCMPPSIFKSPIPLRVARREDFRNFHVHRVSIGHRSLVRVGREGRHSLKHQEACQNENTKRGMFVKKFYGRHSTQSRDFVL